MFVQFSADKMGINLQFASPAVQRHLAETAYQDPNDGGNGSETRLKPVNNGDMDGVPVSPGEKYSWQVPVRGISDIFPLLLGP